MLGGLSVPCLAGATTASLTRGQGHANLSGPGPSCGSVQARQSTTIERMSRWVPGLPHPLPLPHFPPRSLGRQAEQQQSLCSSLLPRAPGAPLSSLLLAPGCLSAPCPSLGVCACAAGAARHAPAEAAGVRGGRLSVAADSLAAIKFAKVTPVLDERGITTDFV